MKAAVLHAINEPLTIEDVSITKPGPRDVVVRTAFAGLCHSDLHFMEGSYRYPMPCVLGHEAAGVVEAVGSDVTYLKPGDHVVSCLSVFCGHCDHCLSGNPARCADPEVKPLPGTSKRLSWKSGQQMNEFINLSAFAEQMLVHEHALVKIRPDMPLDRAALIGCGVITGIGAVFHTAKVEPGSTVAVIGCGSIGLSCIKGAALAGAGRIIAVDVLPAKLALAKELGATDVINAKDGDPVKQVKELTSGGVHYSFEALGAKVTAEQAFNMLATGGTATVIGMIPLGTNIEIHGADLLREKKLQGSIMGSNRFRTDMPRLVDFYLQGKLELDKWISGHIALEQINDGFAQLKTGAAVRNLIKFAA